jgi:hypothetical protein
MATRRRWAARGLAAGVAALALGLGIPAPREHVSAAASARWHTLTRLNDGAGEAALSLAGDVAVGDAGTAFVLDVFARRILAFGRDGRLRASFGAPGHGPGELAAPVALAAGPQGTVFVLDPGNQRIEVYSDAGERPLRLRSLGLDFQADDLCTVGGHLYVLGARRGYILHQLSPVDGSVLRSFGPDPDAADPVMGSHAATGYIDCDSAGRITFLPLIRPELRRFSASDGKLLDQLVLPDYTAAVVKRLSDGAMLFQEPDDARSEAAASIVTLPGGRQLVQVGVLRPGGGTRHEFESLRSLMVYWENGTITEMAGSLPRLLATDEGSMLSVQTDPEPAVQRVALDFRD